MKATKRWTVFVEVFQRVERVVVFTTRRRRRRSSNSRIRRNRGLSFTAMRAW
jgi:hypothetical protein